MKKIVKFFFAFTLGLGLVGGSSLIVHEQSFAQTVQEKEYVKVLKQAKKKASHGKVVNSEFGVGTAKQTIVKKYGQPDKDSSEYALFYKSRHLIFNLQQDKVSGIYSQDPNLLKVTQDQVKEVLGKPDLSDAGAGHVYWTYKFGKYELTFNWQNVDVDAGKLLDVLVQPAMY